jgi:hypothetical protein
VVFPEIEDGVALKFIFFGRGAVAFNLGVIELYFTYLSSECF